MAKTQINFTLTEDQLDVLRAVAFLEDAKPTAYLKKLAVTHLESLSNDPDVRAAMKARAEFQGRRSGKLRKLPTHKAASEKP